MNEIFLCVFFGHNLVRFDIFPNIFFSSILAINTKWLRIVVFGLRLWHARLCFCLRQAGWAEKDAKHKEVDDIDRGQLSGISLLAASLVSLETQRCLVGRCGRCLVCRHSKGVQAGYGLRNPFANLSRQKDARRSCTQNLAKPWANWFKTRHVVQVMTNNHFQGV